MTRTIIYKNKSYNGVFVSNFSGYHKIYIDRQARLAMLVNHLSEVRAIVKLETYQMDVLLDDEDDDKFIDELESLEKKFEEEMYTNK